MKIATVVLAHPRIEWPFIHEWCQHLLSLGVEKVFIGEDRNKGKFIWDKKPNEKYYHLHLDDDQIEDKWQNELQKCHQFIDVETIVVQSAEPLFPNQQTKFLIKTRELAIEQNFDWVLNCDVDEFLVFRSYRNLTEYILKRANFCDHVHFTQILFDSRWDANNNYQHRSIANINNYNPNVVYLTKYMYRPRAVNPHEMFVHSIDTYHRFTEKPMIASIHHFRGIEKCSSRLIRNIKSFNNLNNGPLKPVNELIFN